VQKISVKMTVCFENPFWIGVFEEIVDGNIRIGKIVFGAEPKDYEIYEFLNKNWKNLKLSNETKIQNSGKKITNPKRLQGLIKK